jgi:hypothetical protein
VRELRDVPVIMSLIYFYSVFGKFKEREWEFGVGTLY